MNKKYLPYQQEGKTYNLYEMPDGFVFSNTVDISYNDLKELPDLSKCVCLAGFICCGNKLKNLKGAPKEVHGDFDASHCALESSEGISQKVGGKLNLSLNNLKKINEFPQEVGEYVLIDRNHIEISPDFVLQPYKKTEYQPLTVEGWIEAIGL